MPATKSMSGRSALDKEFLMSHRARIGAGAASSAAFIALAACRGDTVSLGTNATTAAPPDAAPANEVGVSATSPAQPMPEAGATRDAATRDAANWVANVGVNASAGEIPSGAGAGPDWSDAWTVLASDQSFPIALAVDDESVYWACEGGYGEGSIQSVAKGGGPSTLLATTYNRPNSMALDGAYVYWGELLDTAVQRVPRAGGGEEMIVDDVDDGWPVWAVASGVLYYRRTDGSLVVADGDGVVPPVFVSDGTNWGGAMLVVGASLYWSEASPGNTQMNWSWRTAPIAGGSSVAFATSKFETGGAATDGSSLFWIGAVAGTGVEVHTQPLAGGDDTTLYAIDGNVDAGPLAVDDQFVYFLVEEASAQTLLRVPQTGGSADVLETGLPSDATIAVDATTIYLATYESGGVIAARPK